MELFFLFILVAVVLFIISFHLLKKWKSIEVYIFINLLLIIGYTILVFFFLYPKTVSNATPFILIQNLIIITALINIQALISLIIAVILRAINKK